MLSELFDQILEPLEEDLVIQNAAIKDKFDSLKNSVELAAYQLKFLAFMKKRLYFEQQSYGLGDKLCENPIIAMVSIRLENVIDNVYRILFSIYEETTPFIISTYFDKVILEINDVHVEWTRNADNLETDSIEFVLPRETEFPITLSVSLYPDFPVTFYQVPDSLFPIVKYHQTTHAAAIRAVAAYAVQNNLINDGKLYCDKELTFGPNISEIPLPQVGYYIRSLLVPISPVNINVHLSPENMNYNFKITLPNFSSIKSYISDFHLEEVKNCVFEYAAQKELTESLAAVARNPIEAIEAEISGHCTQCELYDESNDNGPKESISPANPARRSSVYYWQQWTSDHISRFLEENKQIHQRYTKSSK